MDVSKKPNSKKLKKKKSLGFSNTEIWVVLSIQHGEDTARFQQAGK